MKVLVTSGKRKTAIARATIKPGKGRVRVNKMPLEVVEPEMVRTFMSEPLLIAKQVSEKVDINVNASGGGVMGQAEAVRTAIARSLYGWSNDEELRKAFLDYDRTLLVNDVRRKESKKQGGKGARQKKQTSYR